MLETHSKSSARIDFFFFTAAHSNTHFLSLLIIFLQGESRLPSTFPPEAFK